MKIYRTISHDPYVCSQHFGLFVKHSYIGTVGDLFSCVHCFRFLFSGLLFVLLQGSLLDRKPENAATMIKLLYKVWHRIIIAIRPVLLKYWICFMPAAYSKIFLDNRYFFLTLNILLHLCWPCCSSISNSSYFFLFGILNVKITFHYFTESLS